MSQSRKNRRRKVFHRRSQPGAKPGTIAVDPASPKPVVQVLAFGNGTVLDQTVTDLAALKTIVERNKVTWINVDGLGDAETFRTIGRLFNLHPLALEDAVNVHQRPKVDQYPGHLFIVTRMMMLLAGRLESEQLSLFLGANFVITFQESLPGDCFTLVRERIRGTDDAFTHHEADYLAYRLLDAVIDGYFPVLEHYGEVIDQLEEELLRFEGRKNLNRIHKIKQDLLVIRRSIWPAREMLHGLVRDANPLIREETRLYLRDCYDHTIQLLDLLEMYRELGSDLRDLYLSSISHRMNEIMKVLTIISTVFIPLTFIVGIYGMNFDTKASPWNMPELEWYWGYPAVWVTMLAITFGMLIFFVRKRWIGESWRRHDPEEPLETPLEK